MTARDLVDEAIAARGGFEAVIKASDWPSLDPLPEIEPEHATAFPFDGLGPLAGLAARAISRDVQAPDALAGGSILAASALAVQPHADVVLPHGQRSPLSVYVITGALSGDRKTATDNVAGAPIEEHRRQQARDYCQALEVFEADRASRQKGDGEPHRPNAKSLTIGKATVEGLHAMLRSQSHVGLFTGEGGELLGGHSLREERRSAGLAWLLKAWGGETLDTLTRGDGLSVLLGRRVCMHALVQPVLLRHLLADPLAQGQGFLARCLVAEPVSLAGTRLFRHVDPSTDEHVVAYHAALRELLKLQPPVHADCDGHELQPRPLHMSEEASALWVEFYDEVERQQAAGGQLERARAFASKAAEHAARVAGVVQMLSGPDAALITADTMAGAIEVAAYYTAEHVRLTGAGQAERRLSQLHALLVFLETRGRTPHRDVLQKAPRMVRDLKAEGIAGLLDELAARGYIRGEGGMWSIRPRGVSL